MFDASFSLSILINSKTRQNGVNVTHEGTVVLAVKTEEIRWEMLNMKFTERFFDIIIWITLGQSRDLC